MKKLISALCTISILLSTAFSSFAAVKITNVFVDGDGSYWYFGSFDPETDTDVGLEVNGKEYNLNNKEKMDIRHRFHHMWDGVRGTGYFGIGLKDKKNILKGEKAEVKPYAITNGEKIYGESVYFGGSVATPAGSTVISSITVGGEAILGVDSGKNRLLLRTVEASLRCIRAAFCSCSFFGQCILCNIERGRRLCYRNYCCFRINL